VRLQNNKFSPSDSISQVIVELQNILDADRNEKNRDADSELDSYVLQVDAVNVGNIALNQLVIFYQEEFSKNSRHEQL
jgi:frataxin-like iron-binding protein CyaY